MITSAAAVITAIVTVSGLAGQALLWLYGRGGAAVANADALRATQAQVAATNSQVEATNRALRDIEVRQRRLELGVMALIGAILYWLRRHHGGGPGL